MARKGTLSVHQVLHDPEALRAHMREFARRPLAVDATDAGVLPDGAVLQVVKPKRKPKEELTSTQRRIRQLYARDGAACWYCGLELLAFPLPLCPRGRLPEGYPTIDEVIPRSKGGRRTMENQRVACFPCNTRKGDGELARAVTWAPAVES